MWTVLHWLSMQQRPLDFGTNTTISAPFHIWACELGCTRVHNYFSSALSRDRIRLHSRAHSPHTKGSLHFPFRTGNEASQFDINEKVKGGRNWTRSWTIIISNCNPFQTWVLFFKWAASPQYITFSPRFFFLFDGVKRGYFTVMNGS